MGRWGKKFAVRCLALTAVTGASLQAQQSIASAVGSRADRLAPRQNAAEPANANPPPTTLEEALRDLFRSADIVFTGEVTEIKRGEGAVVMSWRVEDAVRGAQPGGVVDLREWPGLWDGNGARYTVGERALVMLHASSVAGYASPVAGGDGIVPMRGDAPNSILDLRMLAQHVAVTDAARLRPMGAMRSAGGLLTLSDAVQARAAAVPTHVTSPQPAPANGSGTDAPSASGGRAVTPSAESNGGVDGAMVLGMLQAWQREDAAAR